MVGLITAKIRMESILDFQLIYHLHSGTKCLRTWYKLLTISKLNNSMDIRYSAYACQSKVPSIG